VLITVVALATFAAPACTGGGGSTNAFCNALRTGDNPLDLFNGYDPGNVTTASQQLQRGLDRLRVLQKAAPSEIRDDMNVLVDVAQQVVAALDPTASGRTPQLDQQSSRITDASGAVTRFAADHCGVDLTATTGVTPATGGPAPSS